jgi:uncharacterized protein (TIRG00374 family)
MKKYLNISLKIIVSSILLTYIFINNDLNKVSQSLTSSNINLLLISLVFILINYFFSSIRWYYLLIGERPTLSFMIKLYFIGSFFNNFLPTSIGGDAYKIYKLGEKISSKTDAFTATFLERFIGMFALVIISLYGYLSFSGVDILSFIFIFILGFSSFVIFMIFYPRFKFRPQKILKFFSILDKVHSSFLRYKKYPKLIFYSLLSSFIVQFASIFTQYFVFKSINIDLPLNYAFFAFPLIFLSGYAIPSINSLGSQEVLYTSFFGNLGIELGTIISASFLYHFVRLVVSLLGAYFYVNDKEYFKK